MRLLIKLLITVGAFVIVACSPTFPLVQDTRTPPPPTLVMVTPPPPEATPTEVVVPDPTATVACLVKGNINIKGEKIYFVPGQANYARTIIDESKGERWFCSEAEAKQAGWRKAIR